MNPTAPVDLNRLMSMYLTKTAGDLSSKQREYILSLIDKIPSLSSSPDDLDNNSVSDSNLGEGDSDRVTRTIRRVLNNDTVTLDTLPKNQISQLISLLQREAIASDKQIKMVYDRIGIMKIREMLRRDIQEGEPLTIREVSFLLRNPNQFTFWSKEHPEKSFDRYEYGWQDSEYCEDGKMYYLKFYDLLMIDFDGIDLDEVRSRLIQIPQYSYALYKTYNGYHAFVINRTIIHRGSEAQFLLDKMGCDRYYMLFAKKAGFKVRLTAKKDRGESSVAEYIETIGIVEPNPECIEMIKVHDRYLGITRDYHFTIIE